MTQIVRRLAHLALLLFVLGAQMMFSSFAQAPAAPSTAGGAVTAYTNVQVIFPAQSNFGAPAHYNCYSGNGQCSGGTLAPAANIKWTVDGADTPATTVDRFGGTEPHTCTYTDYNGGTQTASCPNIYATATLALSLTQGVHTVTAYIPASGGPYDSDPYAAFSTTWNVTVMDAPPPPQPHLTSLSASSATQGDIITLTGDTFGSTPDTVYIGNLIAPVQLGTWTDTGVQVAVPGGLSAGGVFVAIRADGQTSNGQPLTITVPATTSGTCAADTHAPTDGKTEIYHFCVPPSATGQGYGADGNLMSYSDSANGDWIFSYDSLNRLKSAAAKKGVYDTLTLAMGYDSFGNRLSQLSGTTGGNSNLPTVPSWTQTYGTDNRINTGQTAYDVSGNVTFDGTNQIAYDADGNVCAVWNANSGASWATQYLYDAEGRRTAKGHSQASPMMVGCTDGGSDFVVTATYGLGLDGEQVSEFDGSNAWKHSNVFADGKLLATYDKDGLHHHLTDHLGTTRLQYSDDRNTLELTCTNLPFGDVAQGAQPCTGPHATENFFTNKERDAESGLDYFGARYYASRIGRFMSPDSGVDQHPEDPQSWSLYAYGRNNPLIFLDPTGEYVCGSSVTQTQCDNFQKTLEAAQTSANTLKAKYGADSSQYKGAQRAIDAYGKQGVDNGVTIAQGNVGAFTAQTAVTGVAGAKTAANPNGQNITVTFDKASNMLNGQNVQEVGSLTAHEGVHVADGSAWVSSGFSSNSNPMLLSTEHNAYTVQLNLIEGFGVHRATIPINSRNYHFSLPLQAGSGAVINSMVKREYPNWKLKAFNKNTAGK